MLGSRATYLTAALGGFEGRALRSGDRLHVGAVPPGPAGARENRYEPGARRPAETGPLRLRISLGPQEDCFTEECLGTLADLRFTVSNDSNRMGVRLDGPILEHREGMKEIVSDANPHGTIQVPPGGHPIVMGADQGITGGYPKIGNVVAYRISPVWPKRSRAPRWAWTSSPSTRPARSPSSDLARLRGV